MFLSSSRNCRFASLERGRVIEWKGKKNLVGVWKCQLNCSKTVLGDFKSLPPILIHRFVDSLVGLGALSSGEMWGILSESGENTTAADSPVLLFKIFIYFNWRIITILCWFLLYISMNQPQGYVCTRHPEPPSHPPPQANRALALGALRHTSGSHWLSLLHMVTCMFQCYSLKSSHPLLPPLNPKVCSLCLCLLGYPVGLSVPSFSILFICINIRYLSFSFWLTSLYMIGSGPSASLELAQIYSFL